MEMLDYLNCHRNELECSILAAYYEGQTPTISTVSLSNPFAVKSRGAFEMIGSGSDLAHYLLSELYTPNIDTRTGSMIAVHIIEAAKRSDPYCGGPTRLGFARRAPTAAERLLESSSALVPLLSVIAPPTVIFSQDDTDELVKHAGKVELETKQERARQMRENFKRQSEEKWAKMEATMNAEMEESYKTTTQAPTPSKDPHTKKPF